MINRNLVGRITYIGFSSRGALDALPRKDGL